MSGIDRRPAPAAGRIAVLGALLVVLAAFVGAVRTLALTVPGFVVIVAGVHTGRRNAITAGSLFLLAGTLGAGVWRAPVPVVVAAAVGTVLAWDMGRTAIDMGYQVGTDAVATRPAVLHAAGTTLVGGASAGIGYGVYLGAASGQPAISVALLLLSIVLLVWALE